MTLGAKVLMYLPRGLEVPRFSGVSFCNGTKF